jgi:hypothetical protein
MKHPGLGVSLQSGVFPLSCFVRYLLGRLPILQGTTEGKKYIKGEMSN